MLSGIKAVLSGGLFLSSLPEFGRSELFQLPEFPVEIGQVVEAAPEGDFRDLKIFSLFQQSTSLPNPDLKDKVDIGFVGALFEIATERIWRHAGNFRHPGNRKLPVVMGKCEFHDLSHPISLFLAEAFLDDKRGNWEQSTPAEDLQELNKGKKTIQCRLISHVAHDLFCLRRV
jgi:hypothetical protein